MAKRKIAESDFLESSLPQTRRSQFFDILKNNLWIIFRLGLILLLFFLPLIIKSYFVDFLNVATIEAVKDGLLLEEEGNFWTRIIFIIANGIDLILYPLIFIGIAGVLRVLRQLVHSEGVMFSYLFKKGIKDNFKQYMLIGLFASILKFAINLFAAFYGFNSLTVTLLVIFMTIFVPIFVICVYYGLIYQNSFLITFRNSFFIYFKSFLPTLAFVITLFLPPILMEFLLSWLVVKQIIYAILIVLPLPIMLLVGTCLYFNVFDRVINITEFPELLRKGLYVPHIEMEALIQKGLDIKTNRGFKDSYTKLIDIFKCFNIKGEHVTSLIEKEEDCYDIITDNKYKYVLFEKETLNEESSDLVLVSLKSGDGYYFDSELQKYFILTNEVSRGTKHHE